VPPSVDVTPQRPNGLVGATSTRSGSTWIELVDRLINDPDRLVPVEHWRDVRAPIAVVITSPMVGADRT